MKALLALLFAVASLMSQGQDVSAGRTQTIWDSVRTRLNRQADIWYHDGDYPRMVQILRFSFDLDPTDYETGTNLGFMLENIDQFDNALAVYIELRSLNPNEPDYAWPEADFYFKHKAFEKIPPLLEPTVKGHDPHANNYRTLAHAYEKMNLLADSKRIWQLYLSRHPDDGAAKMNLNRVLKKLGEGSARKP